MSKDFDMRFNYFLIAAVFVCLLPAISAAEEPRLMQKPDIADDGRIVFTYEDDLWILNPGSKMAFRLTSHPGRESGAHFSPDGRMIAFTANYDGSSNLYVMPSTGGEPARLTWSPYGVSIMDWSADGKYIYVVMIKRRKTELYRVPAAGGGAVRVPIGEVWEAAVAPDMKTIVYTPSNADRMNWRGYRGGRQPDLFITDADGSKFERITDWGGYDCYPVFMGPKLYFLSDREDNRMNVYFYDIGTKNLKRITSFKDWDVEDLGSSSKALVFANEGYLYKYDGMLGSIIKIDVELESDHWLTRPFYSSPDNLVNDVVPSNDGRTVVVESRGDLFLFKKGDGNPVNLTATSASREIQPALSPDGRYVAFCSDRTGDYEVYVMETRAGAQWKQITKNSSTWYYHMVWSPDSKRLLFGDKNYQIYWSDVASGKVVNVDRAKYQRDNEIYWEASDYDWSADGAWIAYAKCEANMNSSIYLFSTASGKITRVTDDRFDNLSPAFDRNGRYLYFLSNRNFEPELDPMMDNNINVSMSRIMCAVLQSGSPAPFTKAAEADKSKPSGIDVEDIQDRVFTSPVEPGNYTKLVASENRIFFLSKDRWGFPGDEVYMPRLVTPYALETVDMTSLDRTKLLDGISIAYHISADGSFAGYIAGQQKGVVSTGKASAPGAGRLDWGTVKILVDPRAEFAQIFNDVWLQVRNFFYDANYQGLDWKAVRAKYAALLPSVATRQDLNIILGRMIAELGVSHMYVWRPGEGPRIKYDRTSIGMLAADLVPDGKYYRFDHIVRTLNDDPEDRNPLLAPDVRLAEGDYLIAIDGQPVTTAEDYGKYLVGKGGQTVTLTINSKPGGQGAWTIETEALSNDRGLWYKEWVEKNYRTVQKESGGRIGYFHLSDMDKDGLMQFEQGYRAERFRDGLIIDVRGNGGGFVSWFVLDKLERKLMYLTRTRDFEPMFYPHGIVRGPMVMLCDEGSGSDGDLISQHFRDRKLGTLIGTRTWGGLIGIINFQDLIDGGMVTQVNVGFADLKGNWVVENRGVDPDIVVELDRAKYEKGVDTQLEKALEVLKQKMAEQPPAVLKAPEYPKKW
jgi:tricorn protease